MAPQCHLAAVVTARCRQSQAVNSPSCTTYVRRPRGSISQPHAYHQKVGGRGPPHKEIKEGRGPLSPTSKPLVAPLQLRYLVQAPSTPSDTQETRPTPPATIFGADFLHNMAPTTTMALGRYRRYISILETSYRRKNLRRCVARNFYCLYLHSSVPLSTNSSIILHTGTSTRYTSEYMINSDVMHNNFLVSNSSYLSALNSYPKTALYR